MTSNTTYPSDKPFCVYLTTYLGNKLPPFYIGSSSVDKVLNENYHGTVLSKKYKSIWQSELKVNRHLFKTKIIAFAATREAALTIEYRLQKAQNVVESSMFINMSFATINGYFGRDVAGPNNPMYGKRGENSPMFGMKKSPYKNRGKPQSSAHAEKSRNNAKTKTYKIYFPIDGTNLPDPTKSKFVIVTNMNKFIRDNAHVGLDSGTMSMVANNKRKHAKGYQVEIIECD